MERFLKLWAKAYLGMVLYIVNNGAQLLLINSNPGLGFAQGTQTLNCSIQASP
jgi:hypothetical protein